MEWTWVVRREPWFYLRLSPSGRPDTSSGSAEGPGVRLVPRHDCEPGVRLCLRLPPAPSSGDSMFQGIEGHALHPTLQDDEPPLHLGSTQLGRIKDFSGFQ